jgi:DNA-binding transcriptional ArsR family regulator
MNASDVAHTPGGEHEMTDRPAAMRVVADVETLRVLADPLRLAILRTLMQDAEFAPRVMSAKEIAAALDEPQTKLYRHLKQLEDVGLIRVAETRLVSGIVEQRYRTGQVNLEMSRELLVDPANRSDFADSIGAALDDFRNEFMSHLRRGSVSMRDQTPRDPLGLIIQVGGVARMRRDKAIELRRRLAEVVESFAAAGEDPDGVPVHMAVGWYATEEPVAGE